LNDLVARTGFDPRTGNFVLKAPRFAPQEAVLLGRREWTVLNSNFKEEWTNKLARPSDPILRVGAKDGPWEIELKIPHKHIGQVLKAMDALAAAGAEDPTLDVDFLLRSEPTHTFQGKLSRSHVAGEANPTRDDKDEAESVVLAY